MSHLINKNRVFKSFIKCSFIIGAFVGILFVACSENKSTDAKNGDNDSASQKKQTPAFSGFVPVQDSMLSKPRKTSDGGFSYYPADPLFTLFVEDLKKWVEQKNTKQIAAHVYLPVQCTLDGKIKEIHLSKHIEKLFPKIFNKKVITALEKTQNAENNFRNQYGYMIGTGELWCNKFRNSKNEYQYMVTNINN